MKIAARAAGAWVPLRLIEQAQRAENAVANIMIRFWATYAAAALATVFLRPLVDVSLLGKEGDQSVTELQCLCLLLTTCCLLLLRVDRAIAKSRYCCLAAGLLVASSVALVYLVLAHLESPRQNQLLGDRNRPTQAVQRLGRSATSELCCELFVGPTARPTPAGTASSGSCSGADTALCCLRKQTRSHGRRQNAVPGSSTNRSDRLPAS